MDKELFRHQIEVAAKRKKAALVIKHAKVMDVFNQEWIDADVAVENGKIVGIGEYEGEQELDATGQMPQEHLQEISAQFSENEEIGSARPSGVTKDGEHGKMTISLKVNPYSIEAIEFLGDFRTNQATYRLSDGQKVQLSFAGTTAKLVDEQQVNQSDIKKIVLLETLLILILLLVLTRSMKMSIYMMATILISFVSALGLGIFLVDVLFGYDAISTRAPVYAFIFLVALGIDYNIILVSRFLEERQTLHVKAALEVAIRNTGGVISSAGIILAHPIWKWRQLRYGHHRATGFNDIVHGRSTSEEAMERQNRGT
ncbi:MMPL family transporter [Escherichia coli]|nr:MMPL family transporter [Escherichia coli]